MNKSKKNYLKVNKGITLIALVVTIIILIILAGVSINLVLGENGIIERALQAKEEQTEAQVKEKVEMILAEYEMKTEFNNKTLLEFLEEKKVNKEIDSVEDNNDGTYTIEIEGLKYKVTSKGEVIQVENDGITIETNMELLEDEKIKINANVTAKDNIVKIIIMKNGTEETQILPNNISGNIEYIGTKEGNYSIKVITTKNEKEKKLDTYIPETPVIAANYGYALITEYGIIPGDKVDISYDTNPQIKNYYSVDGINWIEYTEKFTISELGEIYAKSVNLSNKLEVITSKNITSLSDALGAKAYDEDSTTGVTVGMNEVKIKVNSEMIGRKINFERSSCASEVKTKFYNSNNELLEEKGDLSGEIVIPNDTDYITFSSFYYTYTIYEISIIDGATFDNELKEYSVITQDGINKGYELITITYYPTSIQKLYKIDEGEWNNYNGNPIELKIGETIYAKGINKEGKETRVISSYTMNSSSTDAIGIAAYDGDDSTYFQGDGNYYMDIDSSMYGKTIRINMKSTGTTYCWGRIYIEKSDGTQEEKVLVKDYSSFNSTINIPTNATRIKFNTQKNVVLYEIQH